MVRRPDDAEPRRRGQAASAPVASSRVRGCRRCVRGVAPRRHGLRRPESLSRVRLHERPCAARRAAGDMSGSNRGGRGVGWPPGSRRHPGPGRTGSGDASGHPRRDARRARRWSGWDGPRRHAGPRRLERRRRRGRGGRPRRRPAGRRGLRRRRGNRRPARRREARGSHPGRRRRRRGRRRRDRRPLRHERRRGRKSQGKRRIRAARIRQSRDRRSRRNGDRRRDSRRKRTGRRGHGDRRVAGNRGARRKRRREWRRRRRRRPLRRGRRRHRVPVDHPSPRRGSRRRRLELRPDRDELPKRRVGKPRQRFPDDQLRPGGGRMRGTGLARLRVARDRAGHGADRSAFETQAQGRLVIPGLAVESSCASEVAQPPSRNGCTFTQTRFCHSFNSSVPGRPGIARCQ